MGLHSNIEWTDATWNPWQGCTKVSAGCLHCYMFAEKKRYGQDPSVVRRSTTTFADPLKWVKREHPPKLVFTCSWSDFFHPAADAWRSEAWQIIHDTPQITYLIATKSGERMRACLPSDWEDGYPNVWLIVSVEDLAYDRRIEDLLAIPAAVRAVSAEPLLDLLDILQYLYIHICANCGYVCYHHQRAQDGNGHQVCPGCHSPECADQESNQPDWTRFGAHSLRRALDWVIIGGESGAGARSMNLNHARSLMCQCQDAGVPVFVKQLGARPHQFATQNGRVVKNVIELKDPKGADMAEWPKDLRVREFPEIR